MTSTQTHPVLLLPGMDGTGEMLSTFAAQLKAHRPIRVVSYPADRPWDMRN
jgi:pimeloyl-[acyl-carrier protein] methyl ester esterase